MLFTITVFLSLIQEWSIPVGTSIILLWLSRLLAIVSVTFAPYEIDNILGKKASKEILEDCIIEWEHIDK